MAAMVVVISASVPATSSGRAETALLDCGCPLRQAGEAGRPAGRPVRLIPTLVTPDGPNAGRAAGRLRAARLSGLPTAGIRAWRAMIVIMGRHFERQRVMLGGEHYQGCTFVGCELVYDGRP